MTEFEEGVWSQYNNNAALKLQLTGGFHNTEAEESAVMPFGVFQLISDVPRNTFTEDGESILLQIKLFSKKKSPSELNRMFSALKNAFDYKVLIMTDYTSVSLKRVGAIKSKVKDVWQYTVSYMILIEKNVSVR